MNGRSSGPSRTLPQKTTEMIRRIVNQLETMKTQSQASWRDQPSSLLSCERDKPSDEGLH